MEDMESDCSGPDENPWPHLTDHILLPYTAASLSIRVSSEGRGPLSEELVSSYWEHGYIVVKQLYDKPLLNLFRDRFKEIVNMADGSKHYSIVKDPELRAKHTDPELYVNKIQELLYDPLYSQYSEAPAVLRVISQLIGSQLTAINCMLINKPPTTRAHLAHQDMYYFPIRPADKIVGCWTAVDPATADNGCLFVVPGSHRRELMYIHGDKSTDKKMLFHGILREDVAAPAASRMHLEMEPGDTVFFHPLLVHGSGVNNTKWCRKAMTAHYASSHCIYVDVTGTVQEDIATSAEAEIKRRGAELSFIDIWRIKNKTVQGVRCNL